MNKTALAIKMLIYLKANGLSKKQELADYLETNVRNIKELRKELESAGYTIEIINGPYGGYRLLDTSFFPLAQLDANKRQALIDATPYLLSSNQPYLNKPFKQAYMELLANDSPLGTIIQSQSTQLAMTQQEIEGYLQTLQKAIKNKQRVQIVYQRSLTSHSDYIFEPYENIKVNDLWYVVGYKKHDNAISLKINRFISLELLEETYLEDLKFNAESMLSSFGFKFNEIVHLKARITGHPYIAEYIYGNNQKIDIIDNQTLMIEVEIDSAYRAKQFVSRFASDIQIISPQWLKNYQKEQAQIILQNHCD